MTTEAELRIQLMVAGGPQVRRELARVSADAERSGQRDTRSTRRGATEVQRAEQTKRTARGRTATEHRTNTDKAEGHERKAIRDVLRDFERAERSKRAEMARTRGASRDGGGGSRSSGGGGRGGSRGGVGGGSVGTGDAGGLSEILGPFGGLSGIVAAVSAAVSVYNARVQRSTQILGLQSNDEILSRYQELDLRLTNTLLDAQMNSGMSQEQADGIRARVWEQVDKRGIDPEELISMLGTAQGRFDMLGQFADSMDLIGQVSIATTASVDDLGAVLGGATQQLDLTSGQYGDALGVLAQQAAVGSIEFQNLSKEFAPVMGAFGAVRDSQGLEAMREFGMMAQVMGTLGVSPAESATVMERTLAGLSDSERQGRFQEVGISLTDPTTGMARPVDDIARDMANNRALDNPQTFAEVVGGDVNQQRGFRALRDTQIRDPEFISGLMAADGAAGQAQFAARETMVEGRASHQARVLNGQRVAALVTQAEPLVGEHVERARDMSDFTAANPRMEEAIPDVALPIIARIYQTQQRNQQSNASAGFVGLGPQRAAFKDIAKTGGGVSGVGPVAPVAAAAMPNPGSERVARATEESASVMREQIAALRENTAATRAATTGPDTGGETGL